MMDLRLISVWRAKREKKTDVGFHTHNYPELVYYLSGSGRTTIGGRAYHYGEATFVLIPPGVSHDERHDTDTEVICLEFANGPETNVRVEQDGLDIVGRLLREILLEAERQDLGYRDMIGAKLCQLWLHLQRMERGGQQEKSFEYIINHIRENYHDKLLLSHCAGQLGLSYDYFQHRFRKLTGISPRRFLLLRRLEASRELLRDGRLSCTEIALRCGFSTSAQYSALFRREYGMTPSQYRQTPCEM